MFINVLKLHYQHIKCGSVNKRRRLHPPSSNRPTRVPTAPTNPSGQSHASGQPDPRK